MRLSGNLLRNRVALWHYTATLAAHTASGLTGSGTEYPAAYADGVPCSVQPQEPPGGVHREYQSGTVDWWVFFGINPSLSPNDLITWLDPSDDVTHYLVVAVVRNLGGAGGAWRAECYERLPDNP